MASTGLLAPPLQADAWDGEARPRSALGYGTSVLFTGFAMACNSEFIQWHIETLHGFPYNYQLLYCGYIGTGVFIQAIVRSWLQRKQLCVQAHIQDCTNPGDPDVSNTDGLWNAGIILLGLHFLAASLLQPAWVLVFLGMIQACCGAFIYSVTTSHCWTMGYDLGSLFGGVMVEAYGLDWLFWVMAGSMFVWSATLTLYGGLSQPQGHNVTRRIMSMKNSNDTIGNRSCDLPVCSAVPQPLCHRVPQIKYVYMYILAVT